MRNSAHADVVGLPRWGWFPRYPFWRLLLALSCVALQALSSPVLAEEERVHIVTRGETLYRIALRYGVTVEGLAAANGIRNPDAIQVGQRLEIPGAGMAGGGDASPSGRAAAAPQDGRPSGGTVHIVRRGENLFRLALRYGVSLRALAQANGLSNPNYVVAGQSLRIPEATPGASFSTMSAGGPASGGDPVPAPEYEGIDFSLAPYFRLTHYCLYGPMASTRWVYLGAVAGDASIFALGTRLVIEGLGFFTVEDRFAWDAGEYRLDLWLPTCDEARLRGVQYRRVLQVVR